MMMKYFCDTTTLCRKCALSATVLYSLCMVSNEAEDDAPLFYLPRASSSVQLHYICEKLSIKFLSQSPYGISQQRLINP